ncbi:MAG: hypothetical protein KGY46_09525 [Anaerolineales bacterium]|nr:hypothetical protein [Anaerolineales bacterium]
MRRDRIHKMYSALLQIILALVIAVPATLAAPVPEVSAGDGVSDVIPFLGLFSAWIRRNRTYRTANAYINEKQAYYDKLHAKALDQLKARSVGGLRKSQVAAYIKVVVMIEQERSALIDFAESEKRGARADFHDTLSDQAVGYIIQTTSLGRVLGAMRKGIDTSQEMIDRVAEELTGGGSGLLEEVGQVRKIAERLVVVGGAISGKAGSDIRSAAGRVVAAVDRPTAEIREGLEQVSGDLAVLDSQVAEIQSKGYSPTGSELAEEGAVSLVTGEATDPAVEAIVGLLVARSGGEGDFRGRARSALLGQFVARCAAIARSYQKAVADLEGAAAGESLSDEDKVSACQAIDIDELEGEAQATTEAARKTETPEADEAPPAVDTFDLCSLLPVDESRIVHDLDTNCTVNINHLTNCSGCRDYLSINRKADRETALEKAYEGHCGNLRFKTRGETPIGDGGYTCTDISGEEYKPGVAQGFFRLKFSYQEYLVRMSSGYPGQEAVLIDLGQQIIDRIDQLRRAPE